MTREEATNKELVLTMIKIQGYLSRYGRSHTNWHETLTEAQKRLGCEDRLFPRREEATNEELIQTIIEIQEHLALDDIYLRKTHTGENWHETLNEVIARLEQAESRET
jgi:hypothetical protein